MKTWYLYLIRTKYKALYTGISLDVARRLQEHQQGKGAKALKGKEPLKLVFSYKIGDFDLALRVERKIKSLSKIQKEAIISSKTMITTLIKSCQKK